MGDVPQAESRGDRAREGLCRREGSVWAGPVAVENGEPGVSEHSKSWDFI